MSTWLLLHFQLPGPSSAGRVYIWRKLKRLRAVLLQSAVWVLPDTPRTAEHFQWLAAEVQELRGEALLWRSNLVLGIQEPDLIRKFVEPVEREYRALLKRLDRRAADRVQLSREFQQIARVDYFNSELGRLARARLLAPKGRTR
jgi:hypothetical protein